MFRTVWAIYCERCGGTSRRKKSKINWSRSGESHNDFPQGSEWSEIRTNWATNSDLDELKKPGELKANRLLISDDIVPISVLLSDLRNCGIISSLPFLVHNFERVICLRH